MIYRWPCPTCGREVVDGRAYRARQRGRCLYCLREANGWQHDAACSAPVDHRGPCSAPRPA